MIYTTLHDQYDTDERLETDGVWNQMGKELRIKIARARNPEYVKMFNRRARPHQHAMRNNTLSEDVAEQLMLDVEARTILVDWDGLKDADGNAVPYSPEMARDLLHAMPEFRRHVLELAEEIGNYQRKADEEAEGNSVSTPAGS